jgi:2-polyprenyl-6-methoxyphenol hydroxylase-like FAD-dependent oxidoreductase
MKPQVLIVGAGPVGMTMAAELARYGVSVRIVDKAAQRTDKSKALVLWSRTLELMDRAGCTDTFIAAGQKVDAANIVAGKKLIGHVSLAGVKSPYPFALMLPQSDTERLLEAHLANLGITIERETELTAFKAEETGVVSTLQAPDGKQQTIKTDWLIGCDGAHSAVRHGLGLSFIGDTLQSDWILADIHLKAFPFPPSEIATYWHEQGVLVVFPISPGRYRVVADLGLSHGQMPGNPTLEDVQTVVDARGPGGMIVSDPIWLSAFRINERKVADYRSGRVFVAGDAAHIHSPAGGQGMNTGMQDAFNLAWKLALVCRGVPEGALLESYNVERSAVGAQVLADAGRLTALATLKNHTAQVVRNALGSVVLGLAHAREAMADKLTEISIGYKDSPLNGFAAHGLAGPAPGERVVPVPGQLPCGAGDQPRFTLYAAKRDEVYALVKTYAEWIDPVLRPPFDERGLWLVRPDGYTACSATIDEYGVIGGYIDAVCKAGVHPPSRHDGMLLRNVRW